MTRDNTAWLGEAPLRSPGELQRAARRHLRLGAGQRGELPWLVPLLFVPGLGASRLALLAPEDGLLTTLWDPDDAAAATLVDGADDSGVDSDCDGTKAEQAGARLLHEPHAPRERLRLMAGCLGLSCEQGLSPALEAVLLDRYARLHARGWTALMQAYWPLAAQLADAQATLGDPQFAHSAHAFAWDWRARPAEAAPALARRVRSLLAGSAVGDAGRAARRPASPGLVIVAENAGLDLLRAALPLCAPGEVLAVYAVDGEPSPTRGLLSMGRAAWRAARPDDPVTEGAQGAAPPDALAWINCLPATGLADEEPGTDEPDTLRVDTPAQLCQAVRRHIAQQLLRQPPTPWDQALSPRFLSCLASAENSP